MEEDNPNFLDLPPELREATYSILLENVSVFYVKHKFVKRQHLRPYDNQWLVPISNDRFPIIAASQQLNLEFYGVLLDEALKGKRKIITHIPDFDFRPLSAFIKSLKPSQKKKINESDQPKLIAALSITATDDLDAKKLGEWVKFRKAGGSGLAIEYLIDVVEKPETFWEHVERLKSAFADEGDVHEIFRACVLWRNDPVAAQALIRSYSDGAHNEAGEEDESMGLNGAGEQGDGDDDEEEEHGAGEQSGEADKDSERRRRVRQEPQESTIGTGNGLAALYGFSTAAEELKSEDEDQESEDESGGDGLDSDMMSSDGESEEDDFL